MDDFTTNSSDGTRRGEIMINRIDALIAVGKYSGFKVIKLEKQ